MTIHLHKLALAILLTGTIASADANTPKHIAAASVITAATYITLSAFSGRTVEGRLPSLIGALVWSNSLMLGFEVMDANGGYLNGHDMKTGIITTIVTGGIIYALDIHGVEPAPIKNGVGFVWRFK